MELLPPATANGDNRIMKGNIYSTSKIYRGPHQGRDIVRQLRILVARQSCKGLRIQTYDVNLQRLELEGFGFRSDGRLRG